jgi:hypothetical protein
MKLGIMKCAKCGKMVDGNTKDPLFSGRVHVLYSCGCGHEWREEHKDSSLRSVKEILVK